MSINSEDNFLDPQDQPEVGEAVPARAEELQDLLDAADEELEENPEDNPPPQDERRDGDDPDDEPPAHQP